MNKHVNRVFISVLLFSMILFCFPASAFAAIDEAADIKYSMKADETLDFDEEDFNEVCEDLTGEELDYVKFDLPDVRKGILYYNYDEDKDDDEQTKVSSSKRYYYSSSSYISRVTFVPNENYSGTVYITYTGYDIDGNVFDGRIRIAVDESSSASTITYKIDYDEDFIEFDDDDFYDVCEDVQNAELDYVQFKLPDKDAGILYYNYDEEDDTNTRVTSTKILL